MGERAANALANHIIERFPNKKHSIERLLAIDPEFLALNDDYEVCVNALQYWTKSGEPEAKIRVNEYSTLAKDLEEEIIAMLKPRRLD